MKAKKGKYKFEDVVIIQPHRLVISNDKAKLSLLLKILDYFKIGYTTWKNKIETKEKLKETLKPKKKVKEIEMEIEV